MRCCASFQFGIALIKQRKGLREWCRMAFSSYRAPAKMKFLWEAKEQWSEWPFHRIGGKEQTELATEKGVRLNVKRWKKWHIVAKKDTPRWGFLFSIAYLQTQFRTKQREWAALHNPINSAPMFMCRYRKSFKERSLGNLLSWVPWDWRKFLRECLVLQSHRRP